MSDAALNISVKLEKIDCPSCSALYAISGDYIDRRRNDGKAWHCPYCQGITSFHGNDELSKLKKQLADEQLIKNRALADANALRLKADTLAREAANQRKRAANGVCPCCTRTFSNVADHIKTKHPEFVDSKAVKQKAKKPLSKKPKSTYAQQRLAEINGNKP